MPRGKPIAPQNNPAVHADRRRRAWELYKGGLTNQTEIARQLGLNKATVCRYIQRTLAELASQDLADAEQYRRTELARLDGQLLDLARIAYDKGGKLPDRLHAHEVMLKIADRRAKLLGLDAPERREHSGPGGRPIEYIEVLKPAGPPPETAADG